MLRAAAAYGVLGLVGFLAQMVIAMEARLVPMATWFWAYAASDYQIAPPSPHMMRDRSLQTIVFIGWTLGVPALAGGMFFESAMLVRFGAWALFAGVVLATVDNALVILTAMNPRTVSMLRAANGTTSTVRGSMGLARKGIASVRRARRQPATEPFDALS